MSSVGPQKYQANHFKSPGVPPGFLVYGEMSSSLHCLVNPFLLLYANKILRDRAVTPLMKALGWDQQYNSEWAWVTMSFWVLLVNMISSVSAWNLKITKSWKQSFFGISELSSELDGRLFHLPLSSNIIHITMLFLECKGMVYVVCALRVFVWR